MSKRHQEPTRLKLEQAAGCDLCGEHHDMLLKRFNTWMCLRCAGPAVCDIAEVDAYALHPAPR